MGEKIIVTYVEVFTYSLFTLWTLITIINQFRKLRFRRVISKYDVFNLVPIWTFFAPNPGTKDCYLLAQYRLEDDKFNRIYHFDLMTHRKLHHFIWNPQKRLQKTLTDSLSSLSKRQSITSKDTLVKSLPYLILLNYVSARISVSREYELVRFLIIQVYLEEQHNDYFQPDDVSIVYVSQTHRLLKE